LPLKYCKLKLWKSSHFDQVEDFKESRCHRNYCFHPKGTRQNVKFMLGIYLLVESTFNFLNPTSELILIIKQIRALQCDLCPQLLQLRIHVTRLY